MSTIVKIMFFANITIYASCQFSESEMIATDWSLFKDTPAWDLALAAKDQDTVSFEKILSESKIDLDYEDPKYGQSILQVAVLNKAEKSVKKLLELGADPNHFNNDNGYTPLHDVVSYFQNNDDTIIMSLLLNNNADPNLITAQTDKNIGAYSWSVLSLLCANVYPQPNKLNLLLRSGVSLEYSEDDNANYLYSALRSKNYELVYILLKSGADFKKPILTKINGQKIYIQEYMKNQLIDLGSTDYQYKIKVIDILESNGINYKSLKPTKETIDRIKRNFPDTWEEYLDKF